MLKQAIYIIYIKYIAWINVWKDKNGRIAHRRPITAVHDRVTSTLRYGHARDHLEKGRDQPQQIQSRP